ncbi:ribosome biogenesis protein Nop16 [Schizosaccharomyces japonicus yFS275]|uniref:Nucleolar protein 16 n=1 Tax=Schizosaccharomyces japonicus (strain yFS275 / FY16936) TaxID=402676 RepID=B6JXZ4_SCHJY|nr:ribosome biogenesis protein Nop16 [Schizosaccharomyces japonicus yFS275]EEB06412.1 ribosome biogenesis protein Nop16 [Schizosaccharomyces japonicus yFS275]
MANPRQRRKQRSGHARLTRRTANRVKKPKTFGNHFISEAWDKNLTLKQNYQKMGLIVTPNHATGGTEKLYPTPKRDENYEPTAEELEEVKKNLLPGQALIRRNDDGEIIEVVYGKEKTLDDVLDAPIDQAPAKTDLVAKLEREAAERAKPRQKNPLSKYEREYVNRLIAKYGTDDESFEKMARDTKLNPRLHSSAHLKALFKRLDL